jgi:adenylyltransferase/sulfurtransferase
LGISKAEAAKARLGDINANVRVITHGEGLTRDNALELLAQYDIVVDGTDNFPTRYLLDDACVILDKPLVYGSIYRFEGQISVFNYRGGPTYRDLFPTPPAPDSVPSCAEAGVLGVLPAVVGSIQANEVVKLILGIGSPLSGRLLLYNALDMTFDELSLQRASDRPEIVELIDYEGFCGLKRGSDADIPSDSISVGDCNERMAGGWTPFILDVREPSELLICKFPGFHANIPLRVIGQESASLPVDEPILVVCKLGKRAQLAREILVSLGYEHSIVLQGGIDAWARDIDPSIATY